MVLPYLAEVQNTSKKSIIEFLGINYGESGRDGELAQSLNLSSSRYPCLSPRDGRESCGTFENAEGMLGGDDLFVASGGKLYRNGTEFAILTPGKKTLLKMNTKLVVFPDKVYFNLNDEDNYELTKREPLDWKTGYASYFTKQDDTYTAVSGLNAPTWVTERYYRYVQVHKLDAKFQFFGGTLAFEKNKIRLLGESGYYLKKGGLYSITDYDTAYVYTMSFDCESSTVNMDKYRETNVLNIEEKDCLKLCGNSIEPVTNASTPHQTPFIVEKILERYESSVHSDRIKFEGRLYNTSTFQYSFNEGFCDLFKPGDSLKISGCYLNEENNMTLVVRDVTPTELIFDENVFAENTHGFEIGEVTIEREVPEFDVVCEHNNRIWGASKEKICASALGDPTNYNTFDGLASDSFVVSVASDGEFTGCIGFSGSVLFFKENLMYKLMGDYPANYMMNEYNVAGVKKGSEKSLVNINERLFYHSSDGVYTYSGSVPSCISYNFGTKRFENASAGAFGSKYYISKQDTKSGEYGLFVYDTLRGIWLREDELCVECFAEQNEKQMMLTGAGELVRTGIGHISKDQEWMAEFCEMTEYINERKCYSKLRMRLELGENANAKVEIRCDRGEWRTVWKSTENTGYTANVFFKPARCDRFSIRLSGRGEVVVRSLIREYGIGSEV